MKSFDFEAGKRLREEGEIVESLRCLRSALDENLDAVEIYVELARTYVLAFEDSGDPLCLDSARKVCLAGLRREPSEAERRTLFEIQDRVEDLLLESQKAEMDAMTDAIEAGALGAFVPDPADLDLAGPDDDPLPDEPPEERGH